MNEEYLNRIIHGDCVENMKLLENDSIDLTVTSPPYDKLRDYKGYTFDFERTAAELYRVTKPGGVVVWVVSDSTVKGSETGTSFKQALFFKELGFNLHDTMIYLKNVPSYPDSNRYYNVFEYMFVFSKGKPITYNPIKDRVNKSHGRKVTGTERKRDGRTVKKPCYGNDISELGVRYNVWELSEGYRFKKHPATFPEKLANDHIISWSNPGDIVLDPLCGSGTTLKMAMLNNRNYIGIETSWEYCNIANERINEAKTIKGRVE